MADSHSVSVFQEGTSNRFTARCVCGWKESTGAMRATQDMAKEHIANPDQPTRPVATTSQAVAVSAPSAVGQAAEMWDEEQLRILKADLKIKTDADLAYFGQVCAHKNLDPFLGEIAPVYYGGTMVIQETVEGLRTIAERSGLYGGFQGPWWCGDDRVWHDVWLEDGPPAAARYLVIRKDWVEPVPGVARWASCAQFFKGELAPLWKSRPDEMLGKTAEVRALRRAFPKEFARAGASTRELSDAQLVTIQARRAGLNDDERHALVQQVTEGRTDSTRELTDQEMLDTRAEIARIAAERDVDVIDVDTEQAS